MNRLLAFTVLVLTVFLTSCTNDVKLQDNDKGVQVQPAENDSLIETLSDSFVDNSIDINHLTCAFDTGVINFDHEITEQDMIIVFSDFTDYLCEVIDGLEGNRVGFDYPSSSIAKFNIVEETYNLRVEISSSSDNLMDIVVRVLYDIDGETVQDSYFYFDSIEATELISSIKNSDYWD